jgi:hypothetical protein
MTKGCRFGIRKGSVMASGWLKRLVLLLIISASAGAGQVRCALVVDKSEELRSSALVSLLEARLSQDSHVQLVERSRIDAILREQQISLAASAEPNTVMKVGKLLRAEAFILLSLESSPGRNPGTSPPESTGQLLRVRVVETAHGFRLWDRYEELGKSNVEATVDRITERVRTVVQKIGQPAGQVIPVGIVDIHRVQLPQRYERLARVLPGLLSARLSAEPRLLMLERESLGTLLKEKQLTEGNDVAFWSSAVLIDGDIHPDTNGLMIGLHLRKGSGEELTSVEVTIDPNAPAPGVSISAGKIAEAILRASLNTAWDPAKEAEEFLRQGQFLAGHERFGAASSSFETARALDPTSVYCTGALFVNEWKHCPPDILRGRGRVLMVYESPYSDQDYADLVSILVRQIKRDSERGLLSARDIHSRWAMYLGGEVVWPGYFASARSVATESIRRANRENRKLWIAAYETALSKQLLRDDYPMMNTTVQTRLAWLASDDPDELIVSIKKALSKVLLPPEMGGQFSSPEDRDFLFQQVPVVELRIPEFRRTHIEAGSERFTRLLRDYLKELSDVNDLLLQFNCFAALAGEQERPDLRRTAEQEQYREKASKLYDTMVSSGYPLSDRLKQSISSRARSLVSARTTLPSVGQEGSIPALEDRFEAAIEKKDVDSLALWDPGWRLVELSPYPRQPEVVKRYYALLERIAAILTPRRTEPTIASALCNIRDWQLEARTKYPELDLKAEPPILQATMLLDGKNWPKPYVEIMSIQSTLDGSCLWLAQESRYTHLSVRQPQGAGVMSVAGVDLASREVLAAWQGEVTFPMQARPTSLAVCRGDAYFAIKGAGIVVFPRNALKDAQTAVEPQTLTGEHELPSSFVTGMATQGDQMWIAFGGGSGDSGLGLYDPQSRHCEVVFCSTRKGSTWLDSQAYLLTDLRLLPPSTLLFHVSMLSQESRGISGLWLMDTNSREARRIPDGLSIASDDGPLWNWPDVIATRADGSGLGVERRTFVRGNLTVDQWLQYIQGKPLVPSPSQEVFTLRYSMPVGKGLFGPRYGAMAAVPTAAVHKGRLWMCFGTSQIAIASQDRPFEEARAVPNDILNGEPAIKFLSTPYGLVAIGNGTVGLIESPETVGDDQRQQTPADRQPRP